MNCIILKTTSILRYLKPFIRRNKYKSFYIMELNKCKVFVNYNENEDPMKISFFYDESNIGVKGKEFSFIRNKSEKLEAAINRIKVKILSVDQPKKRKKSKKSSSEKLELLNPSSLVINLTRSGKEISGETPNIDAWTNDTLVVIGNKKYDVVVNGPTISEICLPKTIYSGFLVYPKLCLEFANLEDTVFKWFHSLKKDEKPNPDKIRLETDHKGIHWLEIGDNFFYLTSEKDFDRLLRLVCIPKAKNFCGKSEEIMSDNKIIKGPDRCPFEDRHEYTKDITPSGSIRCLSYNILADLYADSDTARNELFAHCPPEYLKFEHRKQLYVKEIIGYNADILCMQEVDQKAFKHDLDPVLNHFGISGIYNQKGGQVVEGLTCFYRTSKFKLIHSEGVLLNHILPTSPFLKDIWNKICENDHLKKRIMDRTTALQVALLECVDKPGKQILVGNTHLYYHPESDNIRLLQGATCIRYLEHVHEKYAKEDPSKSRATIMCGDFNSCPPFGVYHLMTQGFLAENCADWKSNGLEQVPGMSLKHGLSLASGCGTPRYTNFTQGFEGCLDYIFYDKNKLNVKDVVPLPTHEQVTELIALPNKKFPSDHLALICTLTWKE